MKKELSEFAKKRLAIKEEKKIAHQKEIKENKEKNLEKYGCSVRKLKGIRNLIRKLAKEDESVEYILDLETYANNLDSYISILKDHIYLDCFKDEDKTWIEKL